MAVLEILTIPDPRLKHKSSKIDFFDVKLKKIVKDMYETLYASGNGIGLAAPQVGILKRLVVIDCSEDRNLNKPIKFINPEIISLSKNIAEFEEGCLSLPKQFAKVKRPAEVNIRYLNIKGKVCEEKFDGLEATCIQHEIDHLNGKLFVDHISKLKKNFIIKKLKKIKKTYR